MSEHACDSWEEALRQIEDRAGSVDATCEWPAQSVADLKQAGAMAWGIPAEFGGTGMDAVELHQRYEGLCGACLTTGLVFTQRDAAVRFLVGAERRGLAERLLGQMARGEIFVTIGISQLTTSRRHLGAAVVAEKVGGGYVLNGVVPWVTSLHRNSRVVVGAVAGEGGQMLLALDVKSPGVELGETMKLAALTGSDTGEMRLRNVTVPAADVLRGPCEDALAGSERGFGLTTCILPLGVAGGALLQAQGLARTHESARAVERLRRKFLELRQDVYRVGSGDADGVKSRGAELRARANVLASRASLAALELAKGSGFLLGQAAQRRAREAMFFFVWSSPAAVVDATLSTLVEP